MSPGMKRPLKSRRFSLDPGMELQRPTTSCLCERSVLKLEPTKPVAPVTRYRAILCAERFLELFQNLGKLALQGIVNDFLFADLGKEFRMFLIQEGEKLRLELGDGGGRNIV